MSSHGSAGSSPTDQLRDREAAEVRPEVLDYAKMKSLGGKEFDGMTDLEKTVDWLMEMEDVFEYMYATPEEK
ncbi:hypothetical protein LINPERPRIM_LOCUS485, partial [Linum perenne]